MKRDPARPGMTQTLPFSALPCPPIDPPDNGMSEGQHMSYGNTVHFKCLAGYFLTGSDSVTCREDQTWSSALPVCTGKIQHSLTPVVKPLASVRCGSNVQMWFSNSFYFIPGRFPWNIISNVSIIMVSLSYPQSARRTTINRFSPPLPPAPLAPSTPTPCLPSTTPRSPVSVTRDGGDHLGDLANVGHYITLMS